MRLGLIQQLEEVRQRKSTKRLKEVSAISMEDSGFQAASSNLFSNPVSTDFNLH